MSAVLNQEKKSKASGQPDSPTKQGRLLAFSELELKAIDSKRSQLLKFFANRRWMLTVSLLLTAFAVGMLILQPGFALIGFAAIPVFASLAALGPFAPLVYAGILFAALIMIVTLVAHVSSPAEKSKEHFLVGWLNQPIAILAALAVLAVMIVIASGVPMLGFIPLVALATLPGWQAFFTLLSVMAVSAAFVSLGSLALKYMISNKCGMEWFRREFHASSRDLFISSEAGSEAGEEPRISDTAKSPVNNGSSTNLSEAVKDPIVESASGQSTPSSNLLPNFHENDKDPSGKDLSDEKQPDNDSSDEKSSEEFSNNV